MRDDMVDLILGAELSDRTFTVALRLLRLAGETGQVNMTWETFCLVCDTKTRNGAGRYLTALQDAGLIHYSTNDYVYVTWKAFLHLEVRSSHLGVRDHDGEDAEEQAFEDESAPGSANFAPGSAKSAREEGYTSHVCARPVVGWLDGSDPGSLEEMDQPTNQRVRAREPRQEVARPKLEPAVTELLADPLIGLDGGAVRAAMGLPFEQVLTICVRWRIDFDTGRCDGTGALLHRLRARWKTPALTEMDRRHELYKRHGAEIERERERKRYRPDEYADLILG